MWRWDGQQWVPTDLARPPQPAGPKRTWIWWAAGGCGLLLLIAVYHYVAGWHLEVDQTDALAVASRTVGFPVGHASAQLAWRGLLSRPAWRILVYSADEPSTTRDYTYYGTNLAPGDTRECQEVLASNDDVSTVTDFYAGKLSTGDWKITSDDRATGELKFARVSRPLTVGVVDMLGRGQHTVIQIKLDS